ncbi:hypothetical protein COT47_01465 [Candidatus Woesearchaeota archaeon CG08_land_8_20_14_0_20_43_7]|nr:MAG: hypothetical protein COT47_01465 [Candidatus Woesearchaeota archaeon CG08_land_8_20_14_0_20_43_7]
MGIDTEYLEQLKGLLSELRDLLSAIEVESDGSINANINGTVDVDTISIKDPLNDYRAKVDADGKLHIKNDLIQYDSFIIRDASNPLLKASVDGSGRLLVATPPTTPPPQTTPVIITAFGAVSGNVDSSYTITNGKKLVIGRLLAGSQDSNSACRVTLYDNPSGDGITLTLIATLYVNGSSDKFDLSEKILGDGNHKIILRRTNLGGGSKEMFARFEGYEE